MWRTIKYQQALVRGYHDCVELLMNMCYDEYVTRLRNTRQYWWMCVISDEYVSFLMSVFHFWWICVDVIADERV